VNKPGPKPTVTAEIKAEIVEALRLGMSQAEALLVAGVSFAAFRRAKADDEEFGRGVKNAAALGKRRHLRRVEAAEERWQASAWFLERKYGAEFGKKVQLQGDPDAPLRFTLEHAVRELQRADRDRVPDPQTGNGRPGRAAPLPE